MRRSLVGWIAGTAVLALIGAGVLAVVTNRSTFHPPAWEGPAAFIRHEGVDRLCLPLRQEETRMVFDGRGSRFPALRSRAFYHFSLRCHDPVTARPLATHPLAIISDLDGGRQAQFRVIGQEREFLWLFLRDEPLAIRVTDGRLAASRALLERQFPQLRDRLPTEPRGYGFDAGLVFLTAAAEPLRLRLADMSLGPYEAPPDRSAIGRESQWHGRFRSRDFLTRRAVSADRWLGLYTEREAADAANDGFGDKFRGDAAVLDEGAATRRRWWRAETGRTREFSEGSHPRLTALRPAGDGQAYLAGGLMKRPGRPEALALADPAGWLLLHRTRIDEEGRLVASRLDGDLATLWSTPLPIAELTNRWELSGRLLFLGEAPGALGRGRLEAHIVSLDLATGGIATWNIAAEAP